MGLSLLSHCSSATLFLFSCQNTHVFSGCALPLHLTHLPGPSIACTFLALSLPFINTCGSPVEALRYSCSAKSSVERPIPFYSVWTLIRIQLLSHQDQTSALVEAVSLSAFPLLFFYTALFYTDLGSTFFVLLSCSLTMQAQRWPGALAGAVALVFRQTNIVWVGWAAAIRLLDDMQDLGVPTSAWNMSFTTALRVARLALHQLGKIWWYYLGHAGAKGDALGRSRAENHGLHRVFLPLSLLLQPWRWAL